MNLNIPDTSKKRVVVIGGGFAGISLIKKLDSKKYQTVLLDRNNYHQFQPLIYQVASSGLEPSSICFPLRRIFRHKKDFFLRVVEVLEIDGHNKTVHTSSGDISYDYLAVCAGATTNFYGNSEMEKVALPMKSVEEAIYLRNRIIELRERSLIASDEELKSISNIVIVGGGATGVEIAGVLCEMRDNAPVRDAERHSRASVNIYLISPGILKSMSDKASAKTTEALRKMGVNIIIGRKVVDYADKNVILDDGTTIKSELLIWVSGIKAVSMKGIPEESIGQGGRIMCDRYMKIKGMDDAFSAGDIALTSEEAYPKGHPQMAQVAMQQATMIAANLNASVDGKEPKEFKYHDLGSMATIGRNRAVADLGSLHLSGFIAWGIWMVIHLRSILGVRNKIIVLIDWIINYINFRNSIKLLLFKGRR